MNEWSAGQILFDDLKLEKAIGAGAFGEVWRAKQLSWDRDVAVKRVIANDETRIRSMEQEALHWLEIGLHPYVTTCYYTRRYEEAPVIVLEYASGGALDGLMKDGSLLFEEDAVYRILKYSLEAAWGLACAHKAGLLHLDVKPANILLENGQAKITDFGIASRLGQELVSSGTRAFAPPEQLSREDVNEKTDVFSWAVSVFALFKHEVSWAVGAAAPEVLEDAWALGELPLSMPEDVYHLLMTCMNEEPALRPTMEEAADDLLFIMQTIFPNLEMPVKVVDRQPLTAAEYNNRAVYMYETGDLEGAEEYFNTATKTASDIKVPQYNKGLVDYYAGRTTPAKLLESNMNRGLGTLSTDLDVASRILMINGDARSIEEDPKLIDASPAAEAWIGEGAPGALDIKSPHTAAYLQADDQRKIKTILTTGGLSRWNKNPNAIPVELTVSAKRKTLLLDNDKGAVLLGGLNSGAKPWTTCMLFGENIKLDTLYFLGENAVLYVNNGLRICDFSDPDDLIFSHMPDTPEARALGSIALQSIESLDNVSCMLVKSHSSPYAVIILDLTNGINNALSKIIFYDEIMLAFKAFGREPDITFCADGSVLINGLLKISPERWGGEKRVCDDPDFVMPSNNTKTPISKIFGNFGEGNTLIRHSPDYHSISGDANLDGFSTDNFEYACLWKAAPYRFIAMAFDDVPADGGSLILEHQGEFFVARIDKRDTPPPSKAEWLMMKAVSGAVAKNRRDVIEKATADYDRLLQAGAYEEISGITNDLRPLLESGDENALVLWKRIARDFPRGNAFMGTEVDSISSDSQTSYIVKPPKPIFPGLPFKRDTAIGKVRFKYNENQHSARLVITNDIGLPVEFSQYGDCKYVTCGEESDDGVYQSLLYSQMGEDGKLIVGRSGILIRVFDVVRLNCVLEIYRPGLQPQGVFMRWSYHTLLLYLGNEGIFSIDFNEWPGADTSLPQPIIPDIINLHDVAFRGDYLDELFTGENNWRFCFEIQPMPKNPLESARYENLKHAIPRRPAEKRAMLLRNGFGNICTERLLAGR